jgi:hypothetical protein
MEHMILQLLSCRQKIMKLLPWGIFAIVFIITGCGINQKELAAAQKFCNGRGGIYKLDPALVHPYVTCRNGDFTTKLQVN